MLIIDIDKSLNCDTIETQKVPLIDKSPGCDTIVDKSLGCDTIQ